MIKIDQIPTDQLRNSLKESEWKSVVGNVRCQTEGCRLSGWWFVKLDHSPDGEEHWRCQGCKETYSFKVPYKGYMHDEY